MASNETKITEGSGNVFADLGFANADEHLLKAQLVSELQSIIDDEGITQTKAARILGISQPDLSHILRGRFRGYSIERIMRFLQAFDCEVGITVRHRPVEKKQGRVVSFALPDMA